MGNLTRDNILNMLKTSNDYVSGQEICETLGLSRTAVWKHINTLKSEGYEISSVNNRGYRLDNAPDILNENTIKENMKTKWLGKDIIYLVETDSTNTQAKRIGENGGKHGTIVVTDKQTAGKGRRGRGWISPPGNTYFSILLYPDIKVDRASMITLVAAMAVAGAVEEYSRQEAFIKWPNDVVVNGKKICGILTESSTDLEYIQYVVVGIGINCNQKDFDKDIADKATSVALEMGCDIVRGNLLARVFELFEKYYDLFMETEDLSKLKEEYNAHLINIGREVKIIDKDNEYVKKALGIDESGALIVEDENGSRDYIISGEVSVRGLYGYV
ncbi:MAG: biotin--[acetyl-CoA-carboxylase] ligase [Lachnospiraceae bacterium]|nr:biotin--[acetyl-CoA-carboxylase] ligase [Lachnospiraceae bacterium]